MKVAHDRRYSNLGVSALIVGFYAGVFLPVIWFFA